MGELIEFNYRSRVAKSWESLDSYRKFLAQEDKLALLERYEACSKELREPTLQNWHMKLCIFGELLVRAETPEFKRMLCDNMSIAYSVIRNFTTKGTWE